MNEFFGWLATSAVTIIAVVIVWFVMKYAFKWATAGPWGVFLLIVSAVITVVAARLFLVPLIDDLYKNVKGDVADSAMAADIVSVLGAAPGNLGFTGEGASILERQTEGQVPTAGEEVPSTSETQIILAAEPAAVSVAAPTVFEFAGPYVVTSTNNFLVLEYPDGRVEQKDVTGIESTACGVDLRRVDSAGKPTHALACPASDRVTFSLSQVTLPPDWPQLPVGLMPQQTVLSPEGSGGGGGNWLVGGDTSGQCLQAELKRLGFVNSNQFGTDWLPSGTTWTLSYPGWWSAAFTFGGNEVWNLQSRDWNWLVFKINGILARAMGPKADVNTVFGTGPVPESCR